MKYKIGDELENGNFIKTIDSIIGRVYVCIDKDGTPTLYTDNHFEINNYKLKVKEAPADGVAVIVTDGGSDGRIRISAGSFAENGELMCYWEGAFKGLAAHWKNWRLYK